MKIALSQMNPIVGDFAGNRKKIKDDYATAVSMGADLVVFPELAITGYPPQDLLYWDSFIAENLDTLNTISADTTVPMILGFVRKKNSNIYNSAALCSHGEIAAFYDKILLPMYDVFDEARYFTAGTNPGIFEIEIKLLFGS